MVAAIVVMVLLDAAHPPTVSTALAFAVRAGDESNVVLFGLAVGITAVLVVLERVALWLLARRSRVEPPGHLRSRPGQPAGNGICPPAREDRARAGGK
jgi:hypothetical protein